MFVMGTPAPQGSKRHVGHGRMVESSKRVGPWREAVVAQCQRFGLAGAMLPGPIAVDVAFYLLRPRGHFGTGRNAARVKDSAPPRPAGRPDLDKLCRSTLDALVQAGVIADDSLVVTLNAEKHWCDEDTASPGAWLTVRAATSHPHARPDDWADPVPRVLPGDLADSFRCACGAPTLADVAHSAAICAGPEQDGAA